MNQTKHFNIWFFIMAFLGVMIIHDAWVNLTQVESIPYSRFLELLEQDRISEIYVTDKSISGIVREPQGKEKNKFVSPGF